MGLKKYSPSDIQVVAYIVIVDDMDGTHAEYEVENNELWEAGGKNHPNLDRCDCCGHRLKYSCILYSMSDQKFFSVGRTCTSKIVGLQTYINTGMAQASIAILERMACEKREKAYLAENPTHAPIIEQAKASKINLIKELYAKLRRYGTLSKKQFECMERILTEDSQRRLTATGVVPSGRVKVKGTIISFKTQVDQYSGEILGTKMLVDLGNGVRVYGSKPSALECPVGSEIEFKATFQPSQNDPLWGYFSRPAMA